ncbi:MAG: M23 family metallopeptidase [Myxococcota bacterium]
MKSWALVLAALLPTIAEAAGPEPFDKPAGEPRDPPHLDPNLPVFFDPPEPRLGDLLLVYVHAEDARVLRGGLRIFGYEVELMRVDAQHLRAVVAVPIDLDPGKYAVEIDAPGAPSEAVLRVVDRPFEESRLTVAPKFTEKPTPELRRRLAQEERAWAAMFALPPEAPRFAGVFVRPVLGEVTSPYGVRRTFNGKLDSRHYGLDLEARVGDPIHAAAPGKVVMSAMRWASGGTVVLDHGDGMFTAYFHMSKRLRKVGEVVRAGTLLGLAGKTGRVTGPHLHFSVLVRMETHNRQGTPRAVGLFVDPEAALGLTFLGDARYLEPAEPPAEQVGRGG